MAFLPARVLAAAVFSVSLMPDMALRRSTRTSLKGLAFPLESVMDTPSWSIVF